MPTNKEIEEWITKWVGIELEISYFDMVKDALTHFAPASRLAGMTVEEIETTLLHAAGITRRDIEPEAYAIDLCTAARVAHRLAREPAVDRDAGAKAAYTRYFEASGYPLIPWETISEKQRNGWRAVAAQQEKRDGTD
jgi:hypothetical protein